MKYFLIFCYSDPAGWKLIQSGTRGATVRLGSGKDAMMIRARAIAPIISITVSTLGLMTGRRLTMARP